MIVEISFFAFRLKLEKIKQISTFVLTNQPMDQSICAGIDIGGTNTKYSFVDRSGKIIFKSEVPTGNSADPNELIERVCNELKHSANRLGIQDLLAGIGIELRMEIIFPGLLNLRPI